MKINYHNQPKIYKIGGNLFNMNRATNTFRKLMERNAKEKQLQNKKINHNKTQAFLDSLDDVFFKAQLKQRDEDYLLGEIKLRKKIEQNMINMYGRNAKYKSIAYINEPSKFNKNLLVNPLKDDKYKNLRFNSFRGENKNEKKIILPTIINTSIKILNKNESTEKELIKDKKENDNSIENKIENDNKSNNNSNKSNNNNKKEENEISQNINSKIELNNLKNENSINNSNNSNNNSINNIDIYKPNNSNKLFHKINSHFFNLNSNRNISSMTLGNKPNISFDTNEYFSTIDNLNYNAKKNEKRHLRYFNMNDYGCSLFKDKYSYISTHYFN